MISERHLKGKVARKIRKMNNEELRTLLWEIRAQIAQQTNFEAEVQSLLVKEEIVSQELKKRELLEWALRTG